MAHQIKKGYFPSQIASDLEKAGREYGLEVAQAIEAEWFGNVSGMNRFNAIKQNFID